MSGFGKSGHKCFNWDCMYVGHLLYSFGIATEQSFRYIELTDAKIWISKNALLCQVLANWVTNVSIGTVCM